MSDSKKLPATTVNEEDPDLEYTQKIRKRVIERLMEYNNGDVPTDKDSAQLLATFLDGIDKQSIAKQRIKVARKDSDTQANIAAILEEMSRKRTEGEHMEKDITPSPEALPRTTMMSGSWLSVSDIEDGELVMDVIQESPEDFFKRVEESNPDLLTGTAIDEDDY